MHRLQPAGKMHIKSSVPKKICLEGKCRSQTRLPPPRCLLFLVLFHYDTSPTILFTCAGIGREDLQWNLPRGFLSINLGHRIPCFSVPVKPPRDQQRPGQLLSSQARGTFVDLADRGLVECNRFRHASSHSCGLTKKKHASSHVLCLFLKGAVYIYSCAYRCFPLGSNGSVLSSPRRSATDPPPKKSCPLPAAERLV